MVYLHSITMATRLPLILLVIAALHAASAVHVPDTYARWALERNEDKQHRRLKSELVPDGIPSMESVKGTDLPIQGMPSRTTRRLLQSSGSSFTAPPDLSVLTGGLDCIADPKANALYPVVSVSHGPRPFGSWRRRRQAPKCIQYCLQTWAWRGDQRARRGPRTLPSPPSLFTNNPDLPLFGFVRCRPWRRRAAVVSAMCCVWR